MSGSDPTTEDPLRQEAVSLATDVTAFLVAHKEAVRPEHAYIIAMECVRVADRILRARRENFPWEATLRFGEARTAVLRAMITLDRAGAHAVLPRGDVDAIHRRLHDLAMNLAGLVQGEEKP